MQKSRRNRRDQTGLTLACLETRIDLVDNIDPAFATDQLVGPMTFHQTLE
jgi:hypothetical protein